MDMALLYTFNAFAIPLLMIAAVFLSARAITALASHSPKSGPALLGSSPASQPPASKTIVAPLS